MTRSALIGYTGFVGTALCRARGFAALYNSANIADLAGQRFDEVICAGAPASMWQANRDPEGDRANLDRLFTALDQVNAGRVILISTIAVLADAAAGDTESRAVYETERAYGRNRRALEERVTARFAESLVVRLTEPAVFARHLSNIAYWQAHQAIWAKAPDTLPDLVFAAVFAVGTLALFAWAAVRCWRSGRAVGELATLTALGAAALLVAYSGLNRLDSFHIRFALPFMALLTVRLTLLSRPEQLPHLRRKHWMLAAVTALWLIAYARPVPLLTGFAANVATLAHGLPADRALAGPALSGAAAALRAGGGACTYAFDNGAALYHLSGLPPCARAMVPVYLAGAEEAHAIAELTARRPPLVIGGSNAWYAAIDAKPLAQRTPALARWLTDNYVPQQAIGGIALWRRKD